MKKFNFLVVDDEFGNNGFYRILGKLYLTNYLQNDNYPLEQTGESKGYSNDEMSFSYRILSSQLIGSRKNGGFSFCEAYKLFLESLTKDEFTFYVCDLKFCGAGANDDSNIMDPTLYEMRDKELFRKNDCTEAEKYKIKANWKREEYPSVSNLESLSRYTAGYESFAKKAINENKRVIIYSSAKETVELRTRKKLDDLKNVIIIDTDTESRIKPNEPTKKETFLIDFIENTISPLRENILFNQNEETINKLKTRINNHAEYDTFDIPEEDNSSDDNLSDCWSLRSLFPRQVNLIEAGIDEHQNKDYILDVLNIIVQRILDAKSEEPTSLNWVKNYKDLYIEKRYSGGNVYEKFISDKASGIFKGYEKFIKEENHSRLASSIGEQGYLLKDNLENVLIIRRVYMGLYFILANNKWYLQEINKNFLEDKLMDSELFHHSTDAYSLLRKDWWEDISTNLDSTLIQDEWKKFDQRKKNLMTALCIELTEIPNKGILFEEKKWFEKHHIDYSLNWLGE